MRMFTIPVEYTPGDPWGLCQRCSFKYHLSQLRKEWSGLRVCDECYDPLPDTMTPPVVYPEGLPFPDASPDLPGIAWASIMSEAGFPIGNEDGRNLLNEQQQLIGDDPVRFLIDDVTPSDLQPAGEVYPLPYFLPVNLTRPEDL